MGEVIFGLNVEIVYEPGKGLEVCLKHRGNLSKKARQHLAQAGKELSLALNYLTRLEEKGRTGTAKKRQKIEIKEVTSEKIKFQQGIELERTEEGEYLLRFKLPSLNLDSEPVSSHLKQAKKEVLLAVRNLLDKAIEQTEEKPKNKSRKEKEVK